MFSLILILVCAMMTVSVSAAKPVKRMSRHYEEAEFQVEPVTPEPEVVPDTKKYSQSE